jgi:hypothetical protein
MVSVALRSRALHTGDTTVKRQDPVTHLLSTARPWVYLGDAAHPRNVFDFKANRNRPKSAAWSGRGRWNTESHATRASNRR